MKLTKKIITTLLAILLIGSSFLTVQNYNQLKDHKYNTNRLIDFIDYDQVSYLYYLISQQDKNYEFITFTNNIDKQTQETIREYIYSQMSYFDYLKDDNVGYSVKKANITLFEKNMFSEEDSLIYSYTSIDKNGKITCTGDLCSAYNNFTPYELLDNFDLTFTNNFQSCYINGIKINLDDIIIQLPKGYEIYFSIPAELIPTGIIYYESQGLEPYFAYFAIATAITILILFIFIFLTPISVFQEIHPYKTIKNWLIEFNGLFFGSSVLALGALSVYLTKITVDGCLSYWFSEHFSFNISNATIILFNFICWFAFYYLCSIILFLLKYMICTGIFKYLKEHTILGISYLKIKANIQELTKTNLKSSIHLNLISILLINGLIVFFFMQAYKYKTDGIKLLMALIYTALLYIPSYLYINKTYNRYLILLNKTKLLSKGTFDIQIHEDLGIFNEIGNELMNIKDGFENAVNEEVKATKMRTELITNVSHDLKTPITCIKNYVTLLDDDSLEEDKRKEYVQNLQQYTNRLNRLVDDLFEVSKVSSGNTSVDFVELDIVDMIKQTLAENDDLLANSQLTLITNINTDHILVTLDSNKTYRIFENLFVNISKYALPNSRVYVEISENDEHVLVELKNISKDEMNFSAESITERFVRGDSSRNTNGSGLGLAIVKSYCELQNIDFKITIDGDLFKTTLIFKK